MTELAEDASIFLIVGGLSILGLVVVLVVLRTAFPTGKPRAGGMMTGPLPRRGAATPTLAVPASRAKLALVANQQRAQQGQEAARNLRFRGLDDVLVQVINNGWGDPRIIRMKDNVSVIRYYDCSDCTPRAGASAQPAHGCSFQAGFLKAAFAQLLASEVQTVETACRANGQPVCEFEVRFT